MPCVAHGRGTCCCVCPWICVFSTIFGLMADFNKEQTTQFLPMWTIFFNILSGFTEASHFNPLQEPLQSLPHSSVHIICTLKLLLCESSEANCWPQRFLLAFVVLAQNKVKVCCSGHSIEDVCLVWDEKLWKQEKKQNSL